MRVQKCKGYIEQHDFNAINCWRLSRNSKVILTGKGLKPGCVNLNVNWFASLLALQ